MLSTDFNIVPDCDHQVETDPGLDAGRIEDPVRPLLDGDASGGSGDWLEVVSPSTGETLAELVCAGREDIDAAVDSAKRNAAMWRGTSFAERARRLRRLDLAVPGMKY